MIAVASTKTSGVTLNDGTTYSPTQPLIGRHGDHRRHGRGLPDLGRLFTFTHAGACTVTYVDPGDSDYLGASTSEPSQSLRPRQ